jgi:16S rRNA (guanine527-N7)-methyltransferase
MSPQAALERGLKELGVSLPTDAATRMLRYLELLAKWNRTYNLTAIRDPQQMVTHHLLDSLSVLPHLPLPANAGTLADAGSGAGLPGIPLAVARPNWQVSLAEASAKKCAFLRQAVIELALGNVQVHEGRVERWWPTAGFNVAISRAFAELRAFIASCRHLVAPAGFLAAMKGRHPREELSALAGECDCTVVALRVPFLDAERHLVLCRIES